VGGLLAFSIAVAGLSAHHARTAAPEAGSPITSTVVVLFEDRPDGSIAVLDAVTAREVSVVPPNSNGFIRGVLRGMLRSRKLESMGRGAAFRLARHQDGRLSLEDPQTGRQVDLGSFGATNEAAFGQLLNAGLQASR